MRPTAHLICLVFSFLLSANCYSLTVPPVSTIAPPPVITVTKDIVNNAVVVSWNNNGASPYSLSRSQNPDYNVGPVTPLQGGIGSTSTSDIGVLNDPNLYFYNVGDSFDGAITYSLSVSTGLPGDTITASGINFDLTPSNNIVLINGIPATVVSSTSTSLQFTVPPNAVSGYVIIRTSAGSSDPIQFTVLNAFQSLNDISSTAVDASHVAFISDRGTAMTSDKVWKVNTDFTITQVGTLNEATGMAADASSFVYYGNALVNSLNFGSINKTNSTGPQVSYGQTGCSSPSDAAYVYGIGVDKDYSGGTPRIYAWEGRLGRIRYVNAGVSCNGTTIIPSLGGSATPPQGIVVDNNSASARFHHLFITTPAPEIREYDVSGIPPGSPTLLNTWTTTDIPSMVSPAQMAITPYPAERLVIADKGANKVILLNPATGKNLALDWALAAPRAVAVDPLASGEVDAIVGDRTFLYRFPVTFNVVYVQIWLESGSGVTASEVNSWFLRAKAYFLSCRVNLKLRAITTFTNPALRDITWNANPTKCGQGNYNPMPEEQALLAMRSSTSTDLNVYIFRNFIDSITGLPDTGTGANTMTHDCYPDIVDSSNSGIEIAAATFNRAQYRNAAANVLAHEIGHALIYVTNWAGGDEHQLGGADYVTPNIMTPNADAKNSQFDANQCGNLSSNVNLPDIIFRSDP